MSDKVLVVNKTNETQNYRKFAIGANDVVRVSKAFISHNAKFTRHLLMGKIEVHAIDSAAARNIMSKRKRGMLERKVQSVDVEATKRATSVGKEHFMKKAEQAPAPAPAPAPENAEKSEAPAQEKAEAPAKKKRSSRRKSTTKKK